MRVGRRPQAARRTTQGLAAAATSLTMLATVFAPVAYAEDAPVPPEPVLINGSFEEPNVGNGYGTFGSISGWAQVGGCGIEVQGGVAGAAKDGTQLIELDGDCSSGISQTFPTVPGRQYQVGFWFSPRPGTGADSNRILAELTGGASPAWTDTGARAGSGQTHWTDHTVTSVATGPTLTLRFTDIGTSDSVGSFIDDVTVTSTADSAVRDVVGFGYDGYGRLAVPVDTRDVVALDTGEVHTAALRRDGSVSVWGGSWFGSSVNQVPVGLVATAVSVGETHAVALNRGGEVVTWGGGFTGPGGMLVPPGDLGTVTAVSAGRYMSLALRADGSVRYWGAEGDGTPEAIVPPGLRAKAIDAGYWHGLAVTPDGKVVGWGRWVNSANTGLQEQVDVPHAVNAGSSPVVAVAAGSSHSMALRADGTVLAWGMDTHEQTVVPPGLTDVVAIAAGTRHSLALRSDGTVVGWGDGNHGNTTAPAGLSGVTAVSAGESYSMALVQLPAPELTIPSVDDSPATQPEGAVVTFPPATSSTSGATVACLPSSGTVFPVGDTTVTCTASSPGGTTTKSFSVRVTDQRNTSWPEAQPMLVTVATEQLDQRLNTAGQARWYEVPVQPDSTVQVDLTNLPADYDLALFSDIDTAFTDLTKPEDLALLGAQMSPLRYSPLRYSPMRYSPLRYSPSVLETEVDTADLFDLSASGPGAMTSSALGPEAYAPDAFAPGSYAPETSVATALADSAFAPAGDDTAVREAFSSAQSSSLINVSAQDGLVDESITASTWGASGSFYVRVTGRNGAFAPSASFRLKVAVVSAGCGGLSSYEGAATTRGTPDSATTVFLMDSSRLQGLTREELVDFAARPDVKGAVVDAASVPRLVALNAQADDIGKVDCPYAKNLVAQELREIVNSYRGDGNGDVLKNVVLVGDDSVIPFFRYADAAGIGEEEGYVPPVKDGTSSQTSLRRNTFLSQDAYGAERDLSLQGATVPLPDLAVGRLVETPREIRATLAAFGQPRLAPSAALVTGYDFLTDSADDVAAEWSAGLGSDGAVDRLITDQDVAHETVTVGGTPDRQHSWTADDLSTMLRKRKHQLLYLAGHFHASGALAADHKTALTTSQLPPVDHEMIKGAVVLSAGCHSGYGIVDGHGVAGVTDTLDWAQAMAQQGATLVAGTGYQYGDTDFLEYSEKLYAAVAAGLRVGQGEVGAALVQAKQEYLATTPVLTQVHQKALLEAALYGLPMHALQLAGEGASEPTTTVDATPATTGPGEVLGLQTAAVTAEIETTTQTRPLTAAGSGTTTGTEFTWLTGADGVTTTPHLPALPLEVHDVTVDGTALRGVGFRGGTYADTKGVIPLTGAPATEFSAGHATFSSDSFFPRPLALVNSLGVVEGDGRTRLLLTPAQHRTDGPGTSTLRRYSGVDVELMYSSNTTTYQGGNTPGLAAPPSLSQISSTVEDGHVVFSARAVGDPSAGMQSVWVTYTAEEGAWYGAWKSLDLVQDDNDSTLWTSPKLALPADQPSEDVRFLVQAVNGVGLVTLDDDRGNEHRLGVTAGFEELPAERAATLLTLDDVQGTAVLGELVPVTATLTSGGTGVPGQRVQLSIGTGRATATTDSTGAATALVRIVDPPGGLEAVARYSGDAAHLPSTSATDTVGVTKRASSLALSPDPGTRVLTGGDPGIVATLTSSGKPVIDKTVFLVVRRDGVVVLTSAVRTSTDGRARLAPFAPADGRYTVQALFGAADVDLGTVRLDASDPDLEAATAQTDFAVGTVLSPLSSPLDEARTITVKSGSNLPVKVTLLGAEGPVPDAHAVGLTSSCLVKATLTPPPPSGKKGVAEKPRLVCLGYDAKGRQAAASLSTKGWTTGTWKVDVSYTNAWETQTRTASFHIR